MTASLKGAAKLAIARQCDFTGWGAVKRLSKSEKISPEAMQGFI